MTKVKYYSLSKILHIGVPIGAQYYVVMSERSDGKTYACKSLGLNGFKDNEIEIKGYIQNGSQFAIVRRWDYDFKGKRGATLFDDLVAQNKISEWTNGQWTDVYFYSHRWYLSKFDEKLNKRVLDVEPFAFAFAISQMEHDKSSSYPKIDKIIFDEFLTRGQYLPDEFILFTNVISTIVRDRNDVKIFMIGNTVNQYSPYFDEMGLTNVRKQQQGTIDVYNYGESDLHVCVEYSDTALKRKKASDVYFAFDNPKLKMITQGAWEMAIYPHCPIKYRPKNIKYTYFIVFGGDTLQCEIVKSEKNIFTFIHRKTTPIKDTERDLIYCAEHSPRPNYKRKITKPTNNLEKLIYSFFIKEKVFYQSNVIGEVVRNYLLWCESDKIM